MSNFIYLIAWIILPILLEFIPTFYNFLCLLKKKMTIKNDVKLQFYPDISIIIPVYNSAKTLEACIRSINESNYNNNSIEVIIIDNGSKDNSFKIFQDCQIKYPNLAMNWMTSEQGKSKALNKALFNANGKYIINIDSDGWLEKNALNNLIYRFETDKNINCLTGTILIEPKLIEETPKLGLKIFRRLEFMEYCQAFLASRNYESETNSIYTLSGAFSAFRKSTILKTQLYNTNTICEDTHLTYQVKTLLKQKVGLCENALFFVDPIDNFDKFYTQRQRWQIGELEVNHMFFRDSLDESVVKLLKKREIRLLLLDHTFSFPKMIWYFAMIALCIINYSLNSLLVFMGVLYILYTINAFLYFFNVIGFLEKFPNIRKYYISNWVYLFIFPAYNFVSFFVRLAGITNSINRQSSWKTNTLTEEKKIVEDTINDDFKEVSKVQKGIRKIMEK